MAKKSKNYSSVSNAMVPSSKHDKYSILNNKNEESVSYSKNMEVKLSFLIAYQNVLLYLAVFTVI